MKRVAIAAFVLSAAFSLSAAEMVETILVRVGDRVVTRSQYIKRFNEMKDEISRAVAPDQVAAKTAELKSALLNEMLNELLLKDRADRLNLTVSRSEIDDAVGRLKKQYGIENDSQFNDSLRKSGLTRADMEAKMRDSILTNKLFARELKSREDLTDRELRERYDREKETYRLPERARVREIILLIPAGADAQTVAAIRSRAEEATAKAKSDDFAKAVAAYSEAPSKNKGGDLGIINRGELLPALDSAVFSANAPAVLGPIETKVGFHTLKVEERLPSEVPPFDGVKDKLRKEATEETFQRDLKAYVDKLRKDAFIQIHEDRLPAEL
jgi:peptidyl-prolyl cis-trans isomerase SurA